MVFDASGNTGIGATVCCGNLKVFTKELIKYEWMGLMAAWGV